MLGARQTLGQGVGNVPLIGIGHLHVDEPLAQIPILIGQFAQKRGLADTTPALDSAEKPATDLHEAYANRPGVRHAHKNAIQPWVSFNILFCMLKGKIA